MAMSSSLRRSKTSQRSLSSLSDAALCAAGRKDGLQSPQQSSSSLLNLSGLSGSSSCLSSSSHTTLLGRQASNVSSDTLSVNSTSAFSQSNHHVEHPSNPSNLIQWAVIFALALQIPKILDEIHLIIDLHYHGFPLLVVLGSLGSMGKKIKKAKADQEEELALAFDSFLLKSGEFRQMESQGLSLSTGTDLRPVTSSAVTDGDDWGHFADLDGSMRVLEKDVKLTTPSKRHLFLTTLEETEDEE